MAWKNFIYVIWNDDLTSTFKIKTCLLCYINLIRVQFFIIIWLYIQFILYRSNNR